MILDYVADGAGLIIERAATLDTKVFRHRDLHAPDELAVPKRLQERVGEAEEDHVVHGPLTEIVIDAKDVFLVELVEQDLVQLPRRCEIVPEWLLDDDTRAIGTSGVRDLLHHGAEQHWRDCEIVCRPPRCTELLPDCHERGWI